MTSNCFIENLSLFSNLDKAVFVPYKISRGNEYPLVIDNKIFAFINKDNKYSKFIDEIKKWSKKEIIQKEHQILDIMKMVLKEKYDGIIFQDIIKNNDFFSETFVDYNDVYKKRNTIEIIDSLQRQINNNNYPYKSTLIGIMDKYFTYIGDFNNDNDYIKDNNNESLLFRIFSSPGFALEFKETTKTNGEISITTLRNIVKQLKPNAGVVIDVCKPYCTSIKRDILETGILESEDSWNRENIKDRINYFFNLDEFYTITTPCGDYDNGITTFGCIINNINNKNAFSLSVYESRNDAIKYVDAIIKENIENVRAIGKVDSHDTFKKILQSAYNDGIKYITFDYGTNRQLTLKISDAYEKFFNEKFTNIKINDVVNIKFLDKMPSKNLIDSKKQYYHCLSQEQYNKLIASGTCEEILYTISVKVKELQKILNEQGEKNTPKVQNISKQANDLTLALIKKIMNKKHVHLIVHPETQEFVLSKHGSPYLQIETKYINSLSEIIDFDFCEKAIDFIRKKYKTIIFTNNRNAGEEIPIGLLANLYDKIQEDEIDRSRIMIYLTYVCNLTIDEANMLYDLMFVNAKLLKEFKLFVFAGGQTFPPEAEQFIYKEKTAEILFKEKKFAKKYMAYLEIADLLCK